MAKRQQAKAKRGGRSPWTESVAPPRARRKDGAPHAANKRDGWPGVVAYDFWVQLGETEKATCEAAGITPTTLRRWRDYFGWDEERKANRFAWGGLEGDIKKRIGEVRQMLRDTERGDTAKLFDVLKLMRELVGVIKEVRAMERDIDFKRLSIKWGKRLTDHLGDRDPEALEKILPHLRSFITEIGREQV